MTITVEAVYENGVLKLAQPLPLPNQEKVRVIVQTETTRARQTHGLMGWKGTAEQADQFALDPELDPQEGP